MPRQHFIIQGGTATPGDNAEHQQGGCCGAVCLTYLMGEVIDIGSVSLANEHNIFVDCRQKTKVVMSGEPTNPFKIQCYLKGNKYSEYVSPLLEGISFTVIPKIWEDSEDKNAINNAFGAFMKTDAENSFPDDYKGISPTSPMAGQELDMEENSFFLGVFKEKECGEGLPDNPAELHYILLKKEGGRIYFNNPHNNKWDNAEIDSISGSFTVQGGEWVWTNYGLYITVSE